MKMMKAVLVMALVLALATPALAELKLNGYYRVQMTGQDLSLSKDGDTSSFVDQRIRLKLTNQFNENVSLVYFGEVDTPWGEPSKGGIGAGGQQSADGVNFETKNVYLNVKSLGWDYTVGIQNMGDNAADIVIDNDVAGITAKTKMGMFDLGLRYAKLFENGDRSKWNDEDMYAVQTGFTLSDAARIGFDVFYFDDNATESEQGYASIDGNFNFGPANVTGFVLYGQQDGDLPGALDGENWAASAQFLTKVGNGNFSVRGIYFKDADGDADDVLFTDDHGTGFQFYQEGLMIFLTDIYYNNGSQGAKFLDAVAGGHGLSALTLKGNLGFGDGYYLKYAAGAFMANEEQGITRKADDKYMGTELDLMVGKKIYEKVDLSLRGAYAFLGDFYDNFGGVSDPEDPWKVVAMLNVGF